jgi:hypothetical protein
MFNQLLNNRIFWSDPYIIATLISLGTMVNRVFGEKWAFTE